MSTPIVATEAGQVKGKTNRDFLGNIYYSFLGIPYGKPPIGELRFKAPVPAEPWEGVRDATKEGPECPSRHLLFRYMTGSEDNCLNLNVYTRHLPNSDNSLLKPVMVWIHGGAFLYGSNKRTLYGPDYLITEDIVLVCINYRLGVFGFLSLEDPSLEVPGNAGMKDMILALQWVKSNIRYFNGDPENVTIFGESAGSASVHYLCLSPLSKGLFHKAIAQSGSSLNSWTQGCSNGLEIAKNLEYKENSEKRILEYLKTLSSYTIAKTQGKTADPFEAGTVRPFGPVVEPYLTKTTFLSKQPIEIIKSGQYNQVPLIMGYTSREGLFYEMNKIIEPVAYPLNINFENEIDYNLKLNMSKEKSAQIADSIRHFYFGEEEPSEENIENLHLLRTDTVFVHGIHRSVCHQKLTSKAPIYLYRMSLETSLNHVKDIATSRHVYLLAFFNFIAFKLGDGVIKDFCIRLSKLIPKRSYTGVCHGDDLSYLFKSFTESTLESNSIEDISVKRFIKLWANFARTGNPTPDENDPLLKIQWKPVTKEDNYFLDIGTKLKVEVNPDSERMKFWDKIYEFINL